LVPQLSRAHLSHAQEFKHQPNQVLRLNRSTDQHRRTAFSPISRTCTARWCSRTKSNP